MQKKRRAPSGISARPMNPRSKPRRAQKNVQTMDGEKHMATSCDASQLDWRDLGNRGFVGFIAALMAFLAYRSPAAAEAFGNHVLPLLGPFIERR